MSPSAPETFAALLLAEIRGANTPGTTRRMLRYAETTKAQGTQLVLYRILDHISEFEYEAPPERSFFAACEAARIRLMEQADDRAAQAAGFLALICLNIRLLDRRFRAPNAAEQSEVDAYCADLFTATSIGRAVWLVYRPEAREDRATARRIWDSLAFSEFAYHKAGTTSFILRGRQSTADLAAGPRRPLVIKCVLFPWNRIAAIARATDDYVVQYGAAEVSEVVVKPIASSDRWVVMPFQAGLTLGEAMARFNEGRPSMSERIRWARQVARQLCVALHRLARRSPVDGGDPHRQHLDLSPNNVILEDDTEQIKLIDLGINHLYSRQVGIAEHDDAVYIAPEIKNRRMLSRTADAYSVGIILLEILAGRAPRDGRTPDDIWTASPALAGALEDLIEERPEHRLLLRSEEQPFTFDALDAHLRFAFDLVQQEPVAVESRRHYLWARVAPTSREFHTQFFQWWRLRSRTGRVPHEIYLLFFSSLSTFAWWFIATKTALVKVDDLVTGEFRELPKGDALYADIMAFCLGMVMTKFYQTIFARITVRGIPGTMARVAEIVIRAMAVMPLVAVIATFHHSLNATWPWFTAATVLAVTLCNALTYLLADRILTAGQDVLSTSPEPSSRFARGFEQWWWTMLLYGLIIIGVTVFVQAGVLHDLVVYMSMLITVTIGVHYISKCAIAGPAVRGSLARAFFLGQRLEILRQRPS